MIGLIIIVILLEALVFGGSFVLGVFDIRVPWALRIALGVLILLGAAGWLLFRRIRAQKRARDLEAEILKQSEQQAAMARPDRRAEILELQKRVQQGITALKDTKLGKQHGAGALYALPWYAIIGPPGAGKTTALKHSGLVFPLGDSVKGVGGTRNCDWWFTNEGILLDTAGRYATDDADREEWFAFLSMLRKHRPKKPINGLLVALSVADLFEATEDQVVTQARKLRARVDEIMTRLDMVLPVYLVFTKCDLIGGFVEYWGDLRKADRDQILGGTFEFDEAVAAAPGESFGKEFDRVVEVLHARSVRVIGKEAQPANRARIFQFPLEFAGVRTNATVFVDELFRRNAFQENPLFRGFYFTSGTQEGKPFERMMGGMARALGIRLPPSQIAPSAESKSYFVTDVFRRVIFPDQFLAGRTATELRRQKLLQAGLAALAVVIGCLFLFPSLTSMVKNRQLITDSEAKSAAPAQVKWASAEPARPKVGTLDGARARLVELDAWAEDGAPVAMRWGLYSGETLHPALIDAYAGYLEKGMATPERRKLELDLKTIGMTEEVQSSQYGLMYDRLRLYLMLTLPEHLDVEWAAPRMTALWGQLLRDDSTETEEAMLPHVRYYLELIKRGALPPWPSDGKVVAKARSVLLRAPRLERTYDILVREANEEVAAITRETIFYGSVAPFITSKQNVKVVGAYTREGWQRVRKLLSSEQSRLSGERWVLGEDAAKDSVDAAKQIEDLRKLYVDRYVAAWRNFLADLVVERPKDAATSLQELSALSEPEWPYLRLLRTLHENTVIDVTDLREKSDLEETLTEKAKEELGEIKAKVTGEAVKKETRPKSRLEQAFGPLTTFAVPAGDADPSSTSLAQYQGILAKLVGVMSDLRDADTPPNTSGIEEEFQTAFRATSALLASQDGFTRPLITPLLLRPIMGAWGGVANDIGSAAGGLWEVSVWDEWNQKLEPNYPFKPVPTDSKLEDFVGFFNPESGKLWTFYKENLSSAIRRSGNTFTTTRRFDSRANFSPDFLANCLGRGSKITDTLFPQGSSAPKVEFQINLHTVSPNVSSVSLAIDGVAHTYKNTPEEWLTGVWPATEGTPGARLRIQGDAGLDEEIIRDGEFGLFHLMQAATKLETGTAGGNPAGEPTVVATFEFPSEEAFLMLDLRVKQGLEVFSSDLFDGYNCARVITTPTN